MGGTGVGSGVGSGWGGWGSGAGTGLGRTSGPPAVGTSPIGTNPSSEGSATHIFNSSAILSPAVGATAQCRDGAYSFSRAQNVGVSAFITTAVQPISIVQLIDWLGHL